MKLVKLLLDNNEIEPKFIADNSDDFGIEPRTNQKFHEEVMSFLQVNSKKDDVID